MAKDLSSIIEDWGDSSATTFGSKGKNISPQKRVSALSSLFEEASKEGYTKEDLLKNVVKVIDFCIPEDKKLRKSGWVYLSLVDFAECLSEVFPVTEEESKDIAYKGVRVVCKKLGIRFEEKQKKEETKPSRRVSMQSPIELEDIIPDRAPRKEYRKQPAPQQMPTYSDVSLNMSTLLSSKYTVDKDREERDFESPVTKEMMDFFGLDENGDFK